MYYYSIYVRSYELERLKPLVTNLCRTISNLPVNNTKQRLAQSEIAKKVNQSPYLMYLLSLQYTVHVQRFHSITVVFKDT